MCRAQFELDDASEADVICSGRSSRTPSPDERETDLISDETLGLGHEGRTPPRNSFFLTVPFPNWVNFSYTAFNKHNAMRRHRPQHRHPNPFGPHPNSDPSAPPATKSYEQKDGEPNAGLPELEKKGTLTATQDTLTEEAREHIPKARRRTHTPRYQETRTVTPHTASAPWDDQRLLDLPYDNPFYSRAIDDALWLPRNPLGLLDLDDTIYLRVSITVDQSASRLGSWIGFGGSPVAEAVSGTPTSDAASPGVGFSSTAACLPVDVQDVDGTEEIALPPIIAQRVQAGGKEVEHETLTRPRGLSFSRRTSSGDRSVRSTGRSTPRRPSILDFSPPTLYRSSSSSSQSRARSGSQMSAPQESPPRFIEKGKSAERSSIQLRPDAHAQADFVAANATASRISLTSRPGLPRTQTITTAQAILHEVLEEEREAFRNRVEEEIAEAGTKKRSWFSWLYWRSE